MLVIEPWLRTGNNWRWICEQQLATPVKGPWVGNLRPSQSCGVNLKSGNQQEVVAITIVGQPFFRKATLCKWQRSFLQKQFSEAHNVIATNNCVDGTHAILVGDPVVTFHSNEELLMFLGLFISKMTPTLSCSIFRTRWRLMLEVLLACHRDCGAHRCDSGIMGCNWTWLFLLITGSWFDHRAWQISVNGCGFTHQASQVDLSWEAISLGLEVTNHCSHGHPKAAPGDPQDPWSISYVECHCTGTRIGDGIEVDQGLMVNKNGFSQK